MLSTAVSVMNSSKTTHDFGKRELTLLLVCGGISCTASRGGDRQVPSMAVCVLFISMQDTLWAIAGIGSFVLDCVCSCFLIGLVPAENVLLVGLVADVFACWVFTASLLELEPLTAKARVLFLASSPMTVCCSMCANSASRRRNAGCMPTTERGLAYGNGFSTTDFLY